MKFIAFLERRDQAAVIERILKHCGLWNKTSQTTHSGPAPPPSPATAPAIFELEYVDEDIFLASLNKHGTR